MDDSRQAPVGAGAVLRRFPPALCGFLVLLALMFTASYMVGAAAGPVAPGMHGTSPHPGGGSGPGVGDMDMGGTHGGGR